MIRRSDDGLGRPARLRPRSLALAAAAAVLVLAVSGCPRRSPPAAGDGEGTADQRTADGRRPIPPRDAVPSAAPKPSLPDGKPWARCDGDLALEDIPTTPLAAVVAGKALRPSVRVVRGSTLGRKISFDFARASRWNRELPCFVAETELLAGFKHEDDRYAKGLSLPAGQYRLAGAWAAYYGFETARKKRVVKQPPYYGLLVLESTSGLDRKPAPMFTPTGRVKGKVAICFKDEHESWIAGSFDVPACGDEVAPQ